MQLEVESFAKWQMPTEVCDGRRKILLAALGSDGDSLERTMLLRKDTRIPTSMGYGLKQNLVCCWWFKILSTCTCTVSVHVDLNLHVDLP